MKRWIIRALVPAAAGVLLLLWRSCGLEADRPVLQFCGGAREVGGSCLLVEAGGERFIIDCGTFGEAGTGVLPPEPEDLAFVLVTHAHLDHCGLLPELVGAGFAGRIYCTEPTAALIPIMLRMSRSFSRDRVPPDVFERTVSSLMPVPFDEQVTIGSVSFRFRRAGHLLGAAFIEIRMGTAGTRLVVSGDLGSGGSLLLPPLEPPHEADFIVMESTYGGSVHAGHGTPPADRHRPFAEAVARALGRGGDVLVPAFTLGRTQEVIAAIDHFTYAGVISSGAAVYVDSPTAKRITNVYRDFPDELSEWARNFYEGEILASPRLREVKSRTSLGVQARRHEPTIFVSSSGNLDHANAPRHLMKMFADERNLLCIVGWQSPGSLGGRLLACESSVLVRYRNGGGMREEWIAPALEIRRFESFSAHADRIGLVSWLREAGDVRRVFLVHGEEGPASALAREIRATLGIEAEVPERDERITLR